MNKGLVIAGVTAGVVLCAAAGFCADKKAPLETVQKVELGKYLGLWYEIARFPTWFQKAGSSATAEYSLREDGKINVLNTSYFADGKTEKAKGKAWVADKNTNAKLKVSFFWPFAGDYWVIQLGEKYDYAVVGHPGRNYLWILCRTPQMDAALYDRVIEKLKEQGYDTNKIFKDPPVKK